MKTKLPALIILSVMLMVSCATKSVLDLSLNEAGQSYITYNVDLSNHTDDLFHVTLYPGTLSAADEYYNFVAFAPGTHQTLDYGRFVKSFQAFDSKDKEIPVEKVSTNQWKLSDPERVSYIKYDIEDSFDAEITEHTIYPMSGTGIEKDFINLNTFGVLGYFDGLISNPTRIKIDYNPEWKIGTALTKDAEGFYNADSYRHMADSPFLIGDLSVASMMVGEISVDVFVYSPIEEINADTVLTMANEILLSAEKLIRFAPVDRYAFLMYFLDQETSSRNKIFASGALEHSYSSTYSLPANVAAMGHISSAVAHEFMHILTPLNLRSEVIAYFDYKVPTEEDLHLWLYEGVTEWVSDIMIFRSGLIDMEAHLSEISGKITNSESYSKDYSLTRLSTDWFTTEGQHQYGNIYQQGALMTEMLDIRILELSNGERGFREVYLDLINMYGKDKPFDNKTFFDTLVEMTYPEIEDFITDHIEGTVPFDYEEYYNKLGISYTYSRPSDNKTPMLGLDLGSNDGVHLSVAGFAKGHVNFGLEVGDNILKVYGEEMDLSNYHKVLSAGAEMNVGDSYEIVVGRGDEEITLTGTLFGRVDYHIFTPDENATEEQKRLRDLWSKNLQL